MSDNNQSEKILKLSEQLSELDKSLESSFKYQLIIILAFFIYKNGSSEGPVKIDDLEISKSVFMLIFPIALLYFVSKMAVLTMLFIEVSDSFFIMIEKFKNDNKEYQYFRLFRPKSIFLTIPLTRYAYANKKTSKRINYVLSGLIYMLPGFSMGLICYTIFLYQSRIFSIIFLMIAAIAFTLLFLEFYNGSVTKGYRYLLLATYAAFVVSFIIMLIVMK